MEDTETVAELQAQLEAMRAAALRDRQERRALLHHATDQLERITGLLRRLADHPGLSAAVSEEKATPPRTVAIRRVALLGCSSPRSEQKDGQGLRDEP